MAGRDDDARSHVRLVRPTTALPGRDGDKPSDAQAAIRKHGPRRTDGRDPEADRMSNRPPRRHVTHVRSFATAVHGPWEQIKAEPRTSFLLPEARLSFGDPEVGHLTIDARLWRRLASYSSIHGSERGFPPVSVRRSLYGMLLIWIATTVLAAAFFYFTSRADGVRIPLFVCMGFPAIVSGMAMMVRFLQQVR